MAPNPLVTRLPEGHSQALLADQAHRQAMEKYQRCCSYELLTIATVGKSAAVINRLVNDAIALCGSPYYRISRHHWHEPAKKFLRRFVDDGS